MDVTDELLLSLLGGVGQGTAKAATLGTTAAAVTLWKSIRDKFRRRRASLSDEEKEVLEAKPGEPVNADVLRGLLQKLSEQELKQLSIYQTSVAGDFHQTTVAGDLHQTTVAGDWISDGGVKKVYNFDVSSDG